MSKRSSRCFGFIAVFAALSCSIIVKTDEIDSGCGSDKKLCLGECVDVGDPAYGCLEGVCEPCRRDNGVPRCGTNGCEVDTCLYGWGCPDCNVRILSNPDHCGHCYNECDDDWTCSVGRCVPPPGSGSGGEGGQDIDGARVR